MQVFLSYAHVDDRHAQELRLQLRARNVEVWRDREELVLGDQLPLSISSAIEAASGTVILISNASLKSRWVQSELSASLWRNAQDPAYLVIPILLEDCAIPALLGNRLFGDARKESMSAIADGILCALNSKPQTMHQHSCLWEAITSQLERDQFQDPNSASFGGWSRSYATTYLPIAFPKTRPGTVAEFDSLTVTCWVIRGLKSLQRILTQYDSNPSLLPRLERMLLLARQYLLRHFDGVAAGPIRHGGQGEYLHRDVRHSAVFVRALLHYPDQRIQELRKACRFSLEQAAAGDDGRIATSAEVLHLIQSLRGNRHLLPEGVSMPDLHSLEMEHLERIHRASYPLSDAGYEARLLFEPDSPHLAPSYTWWVLDSCYELFASSGMEQTRNLPQQLIRGLKSLYLRSGEDWGVPFVAGGTPEIGTTACVSEVVCRYDQTLAPDHSLSVWHALEQQAHLKLKRPYEHVYFLWAIPLFYERLISLIEQDGCHPGNNSSQEINQRRST